MLFAEWSETISNEKMWVVVVVRPVRQREMQGV